MIKTYALLTKPGILMGNAITTASGFILASRGHFDPFLFFATLIGLGGVIASACVFNNIIDRLADAKMERTKNRPLVQGLIRQRQALFFAVIQGVLGAGILAAYTNPIAFGVALAGFFIYVVIYSFLKYHSTWGTIVGSAAGATPPVVGYCAAGGELDGGALLLFAILVLWQMPHFYAIAIYRYKDYAAASIPILPIEKGPFAAKVYMTGYIAAFIVAVLLLAEMGYSGSLYEGVALVLGLAWLLLSIKGFLTRDDIVWGKQMFAFSLVVITLLCSAMAFDKVMI